MSRMWGNVRRFAPIFLVFAICVPGAVQLAVASSAQEVLVTIGVTLTVISLALLLYPFRPARVLMHLLLLSVPLAVFYRALYRGSIAPGVLLSVVSTSRREAQELLGVHLVLAVLLGVFILLAVGAALSSWWATDYFHPRVRNSTSVLAVLTLSVWGIWTYHLHGELHNLSWALRDSAREVYPIDLTLSTKIDIIGKVRTWRDTAVRNAFQFHDVRPDNPATTDGRQLYIVVIGESSRKLDWSLYGYRRPTTPRLEALRDRGQLIVFDNAFTSATVTLYSLGLTLTRATPTSWAVAGREKSIISLLREGGYRTVWISNQERFGLSENPVTAIAMEADSTSFANDYVVDPRFVGVRDAHDSNLIPRLRVELERFEAAPRPTFVFLHMMGCHQAYADRFPPSFDVFHTQEDGTGTLSPEQLRIIDRYDDCIRFTDQVLSDIVAETAKLHERSAILYFSDHGERLFDPDEPDLLGHGFPKPSAAEIEIPFFFWLSPEYRSAHPDVVARLELHARSPVLLYRLFDTIVDLAGLTYEGWNADSSLLSPSYRPMDTISLLTIAQIPLCAPVGRLLSVSISPKWGGGQTGIVSFIPCTLPHLRNPHGNLPAQLAKK